MAFLLEIDNVSRFFGGLVALDNLSIKVRQNGRSDR